MKAYTTGKLLRYLLLPAVGSCAAPMACETSSRCRYSYETYDTYATYETYATYSYEETYSYSCAPCRAAPPPLAPSSVPLAGLLLTASRPDTR